MGRGGLVIGALFGILDGGLYVLGKKHCSWLVED